MKKTDFIWTCHRRERSLRAICTYGATHTKQELNHRAQVAKAVYCANTEKHETNETKTDLHGTSAKELDNSFSGVKTISSVKTVCNDSIAKNVTVIEPNFSKKTETRIYENYNFNDGTKNKKKVLTITSYDIDNSISKKPYKNYYMFIVKREYGNITDTATAILQKVCSVVLLQTIKTAYSKSGNNKMLELYNNGVRYLYHSNIDIESYELIRRVTIRRKNSTTHKVNKLVKIIDINRKEREILKPIKVRITTPCKPYAIVEYKPKTKTELKDYISNDFNDLLHDVFVKALELSENGIITDFDSIWNVKRELYKTADTIIRTNRRQAVKRKNDVMLDDYNSSESENIDRLFYLNGKQDINTNELSFTGIITESIKDSIEKYIVNKLPKKVKNRNVIARVYRFSVLGDKDNFKYSQENIAKALKVHRTLIERYINYANKTISENRDEIRYLITAENV